MNLSRLNVYKNLFSETILIENTLFLIENTLFLIENTLYNK